MTEKVMITQEQADEIKEIQEADYAINIHSFNKRPDKAIAKLSTAELAKALYVGYEIEPEFEVGDWVKGKFSREICKVTRVEGVKVWGHWGGHDTEQWNPAKAVTHATHEEIMQEKDRQKFASIGRKPGEVKEGDIGENNTGTLIFSKSEIEAAYRNGALKGLFPIEKFVCFWGDGDE